MHPYQTGIESRAVDDARSQLGEDVNQPWKSIENCYRRTLLKWGALLDDERKPTKLGWESRSARVKFLAENWRVLIDAAMLLALVEQVNDISDRDLKDLARAIYRRPPTPEDTGRITRAVAELIRQGGVEEIERGGLSVLIPKAAPSVAEEGAQSERAIRAVKAVK